MWTAALSRRACFLQRQWLPLVCLILSLLPHPCPYLEGISQPAVQQTGCRRSFTVSVLLLPVPSTQGPWVCRREGKYSLALLAPSLGVSYLEHCPINLAGPYYIPEVPQAPQILMVRSCVTIRALVWIFPRDGIIILAKFMSSNASLPSVFYFLLAGIRSAKLFPLIHDNPLLGSSSIFRSVPSNMVFYSCTHPFIHF